MTSDLVMEGSYNYGLVALSILIAMLGSYATIELAERVSAARDGPRLSWRIGGATAMAIGTWAMHYTGMLAFRLPVPTSYDWPTSVLSFLPSQKCRATGPTWPTISGIPRYSTELTRRRSWP